VAALLHVRVRERLAVGTACNVDDEDLGSEGSPGVVAAIWGVAAATHIMPLGLSCLPLPAAWALRAHPTALKRLRELVWPARLEVEALPVPLGHRPQGANLRQPVRAHTASAASPPTRVCGGLPTLWQLHVHR